MNTIIDFGAVSDGETDNTIAIQKAIDACGESGGGQVLVPPGKFVSGPLTLRDNVCLHLEAGALLQALPSIDLWPRRKDAFAGDAAFENEFTPFIYGDNLTNIAITGNGVIDGGGELWWDAFWEKKLDLPRPRLVNFNGCKDILLDGVTFRNSPRWTINPVCCENVNIRNLTLRSPLSSPNSDGINPDSCRFVKIVNCDISVGDDCVTIKSGTESSLRPVDKRVCENIIVSDCLMREGHGGVVLGSEMSGGVRNVTINNCIFQGTDRGLRLKTRRGRGGMLENLMVSNVFMENVRVPFVINLFYFCSARGEPKTTDTNAWPVDAGTPVVKNLRFSHIMVKNAEFAAACLIGLPESPIKDVVFHEVDIQMKPDARCGRVAMADTVPDMAKGGFYCRNVDGLRFDSVKVQGHEGPMIDTENCGIL